MDRLDRLLHQTYPNYSRKQWAEFCSQGFIEYQTRQCKKSAVMDSEMISELTVHWSKIQQTKEWNLIPSYKNLEVVYQDTRVIVINKPPGLACHPIDPNETDSVVHRLAAGYPECRGFQQGFLLNRIDRDTSGLIVSATSLENQNSLLPLFRSGSAVHMEKTYFALVWGKIRWSEKVCTLSIGHGKKARNRVLAAKPGLLDEFRSKPRSARTRFVRKKIGRLSIYPDDVIDSKNGKTKDEEVTLVEGRLNHGMMHQIRAHLHALGHPLVGDKIYGPQPVAVPFFHGLHCSEITLGPCEPFPQGITWFSEKSQNELFQWVQWMV